MYQDKIYDFDDYSTFLTTDRNQKSSLQYIPWHNQYIRNQKREIVLKQKERVIQRINLQNQVNKTVKQKDIADYYLKYNLNPFLVFKNSDRYVQSNKTKVNKNAKVNIINILTPTKNQQQKKNRQVIKQKKSQISNMKRQYSLMSKKLFNNITKRQKIIQKEQKQNYQQFIQIQNKKLQLFQLDINDIAIYPQKSYFAQKSNFKINIFKFVRDEIDVKTGYQHLKSRYFSFNAIIEKNFKFRIPIYRDISTMSRRVITNTPTGNEKIFDYIYSDELRLNIKQLTINDLLSIASNRISADLLQNILYSGEFQQINDNFDDQSEYKFQKETIFKKNWSDKKQGYICDNQQAQQIETCRVLPFNNTQKKIFEEYQKQSQQIMNMLQYQSFLFQNQIRDKKITVKLTHETKQAIKKYITPSKNKKNIQIDKIMRQKKKISNRENAISYKSFSKFLKKKNTLALVQASVKRQKINKQEIFFQ